jgi:aminoglycoside phosphotransferase (APT) family kinase protein
MRPTTATLRRASSVSSRAARRRRGQITKLARSTEGFSQETFRFDVEIGAIARARRGLRRQARAVAGLLEPYDLEPEFRVLHALSDDPFPSPPTPWFTRDPAVLDRPFYVMECLPGEVPIPGAHADGRGPFTIARASRARHRRWRALAELHAVDWRRPRLRFLGDPDPARAARRASSALGERASRSGLPPTRRSRRRCSGCAPTCPHATKRRSSTATIVSATSWSGATARGARLTGVLDWEMVHLGDPLEDLAWLCSPLWRAGTDFASAMLTPDAMAATYAEAARPHRRPRAPALLRRPHDREDDGDHANRHPRLHRRTHRRSPHGDLRPPATLSLGHARHDPRLLRRGA